MRHLLAALLVTPLLVGGVSPLAQVAAPVTPVAAAGAEGRALKALFHESDEAFLTRNPLDALYRGDPRHADRLGDFLSDAYLAAERAAAESDLRRLAAIDRARLIPVDRIAYDVFKNQAAIALRGRSPEIIAATVVRPIDHFYTLPVFYPDIASGQSVAPFRTLVDYENNLKRHREYAIYLDAAIVRFREGMRSGVVQPTLVVRNTIGQFDGVIAQGVEGSTFYGPVKAFPKGISPADQKRLKATYAAIIRDVLLPAETRVRDFLAKEYLPVARESVGLSAMPGGAKLYAYLIESHTTLPLAAEDIHTLGLSEVARILGEMDAQKRAVGFAGTLPEFFPTLRTDKRFQPTSSAQLRDGYLAIDKRVRARIGEQFSLLPKTPLDIRPTPAYMEKSAAGGDYVPGTPDGARHGVFHYNTYDLASRYTWGMETLFLHEGSPGHHFQFSIAQENAALPAFMRFGGNTAFIEGWALYAESLWKELAVGVDPYQRMGGLSDEMLRAMRLVVDTGIHAKGWTREQGIDYMLANSPMSRTDVTIEVERYIATPGQALAYKIGQLTIARLKAKAQTQLGARFDPRAFHTQVLDTGSLPMPVLEQKIDEWITAAR
ncbi:MAG: DUF885 domain-containing protein [Vicinamibacteraceae bacterium]